MRKSIYSLFVKAFALFLVGVCVIGCNSRDTIEETINIERKEGLAAMVYDEVSSGFKHSIAITPAGHLYGWGASGYGELGEIGSKIAPKIIDMGNWKTISCGYESSIGIKKDGTLWAAGYNNAGQLGIGNNEDSKVFTQVGSDNDWEKVSMGYRHTLALKKDGSLWAWGINQFFQLGNNTDAPSLVPIRVGADNDWRDISAGHNQCFAIKKDGSLWAWGYNYTGQLGLGHKNNVSAPTKVKSSMGWRSVVSGIGFTGGIKEDGSLWMWGRNYHGELGVGTGNLTANNNSDIPVKVFSDIPWKKVSLGNSTVIALKSDNTLWTWGKNQKGELGIGGATGYSIYKNIPTKVNDNTDWEDISAGEFFSIARKKGNAYWGFGNNNSGQLSTKNENETVPVALFSL